VPGKVENFPNGSLLKFSSLPFGTVSIFDTLFFGESIYMLINPLMLPILYRRAQAAYCYAVRQGTSGMEFAEFGRQIGYQLLKRGALVGISYLLTPVNIVRYFEFPFVFENLPENLGKCLDVSSPRLFSLYAANKYPKNLILMNNPDSKDISQTSSMVSKLKIKNIQTECRGIETLSEQKGMYDCIWSISVVEHIKGNFDDITAMKLMYEALNENGGKLILTVPVDREFREEYRESNHYGTQSRQVNGKYFFQRVYDKASIWERLLSPINQSPTVVRWFGETSQGKFTQHEQYWLREGHYCTINDPREIADNYQEFPDWKNMPGIGVCGIVIKRKKS
jgi:hypothetical protein